MPTSSLIFVLVVAIWAAYLLQHWIRRRDHLSTARSVDRFSEAMRVLERRKPLPESPLAAPEPRSYAVSPARPSRAAVTVKRAAAPPAEEEVESPRPARVRGGVARLGSGLTRKRVRGASIIVCLALLVASVVMLALGRLPWWGVGVAGVLLVADLDWLRMAATATARRARREHAARTAQRVRERRVAEAARRRADSPPAEKPAAARQAPAAQRVDVVYDPDAADESASVAFEEAVAPAATTREPRPGEWQPVPVPPPTYTLKAKAERPAAAPAEVTAASEPFDHTAADVHGTDETVDDAAGTPTGAAGEHARPAGEAPYGRDLPFDGLALDEELEELPPAYAVG